MHKPKWSSIDNYFMKFSSMFYKCLKQFISPIACNKFNRNIIQI